MDRTAHSFRFPRLAAARWIVTACAAALLIGPAHASVLVIAPHPDDDILAAAGVIHRAVGHEEVTVVFMTNGDVNGIAQGLLRQGEAVTAQVQHLGTTEDDLIFLGYPDGASAGDLRQLHVPVEPVLHVVRPGRDLRQPRPRSHGLPLVPVRVPRRVQPSEHRHRPH